MANLGSDTTDANAQSLNLPSGYKIDEDGGDLVIRDTGGTVTLRRTDGGAWSLENNDLNSVGTASVATLEAESVSTESLSIGRSPEDVTDSRSFDTVEANDTDSEIFISVRAEVKEDDTDVELVIEVDGTNVNNIRDTNANADDRFTVFAPVPKDSTYEVRSFRDRDDYDMTRWVEYK